MRQRFVFEITAQDAGKSVIDFLRSRGFSRHLLVQMKQTADAVKINGRPVYSRSSVRPAGPAAFRTPDTSCEPAAAFRPSPILEAGDRVTALLPPEEPSEHIPPAKLPLTIVYEDDDLLVLDKAPGMPVHPSAGNYENTLANGLAAYFSGQNIPFVFRCINRLDRDTSGLLIVARHALSGAVLSGQMKRREIRREYLAVVKGVPAPACGTVDAPIARAKDSVIARCVDYEHGETAVTHYELLSVSRSRRFSLLRIWLDTGRTHQIRVHMKHIGHPLPGDFLYCPDCTDYARQPLHSWRLSFTHPVTGQPMHFTSRIPEDFRFPPPDAGL